MSAIFGILSAGRGGVDPGMLGRMSAALVVDGPDRHATWSDGPIGLGHRLHRFTPEDEHDRQPLIAGDGEIALVFNGRLDARDALARSLGLTARQSGQRADSELVLTAYERWADDCLDHLVGEFTFAVWHRRTQDLLLAASAPLSTPLHYVHTPELFLFASRPRGLFALPSLDRRVDEQAVAALLSMTAREGEGTFFAGVKRLPPAHRLTVSLPGVNTERWWQPDLTATLALGSDREYVEALNSLMSAVVNDHLRTDAPVGVMLSGGLDSGSVAATAGLSLKNTGRRLRAYTEVPPPGFDEPLIAGRYADETPYVTELARMHSSIDLTFVDGSNAGLLDDLENYFAVAEVPFLNAANRGWLEQIYARAREEDVRVLLTGDQGNLTVSWNGSGLISQLLRQRHLGQAIGEARAVARAGRGRATWRVLAGSGMLPLLGPRMQDRLAPLAMRRSGDSFTNRPTLMHPAFAAEHDLSPDGVASDHNPYRELRDGGREARLMALLATGTGASEISTAYRARYGIDTRTPLADRRLVEFCLAVPEEQWARGGEGRLLLRRAMSGRLPESMLRNRLRGLQAAAWFRSLSAERETLRTEVERLAEHPDASRILDIARMRVLLDQWPRTPPTDGATMASYRGQLSLALMTGRFLQWARASAERGV